MAKVALVSNAGGHLTEIMAIAAPLAGEHDLFLCVADYPAVRGMKLDEVGRTYLAPLYWRDSHWPILARWQQSASVILTMFMWLFFFIRVFRKERPDCLITVGAEIAVPAYLVNKLFFRRKALYVESLARIETPSLTGRLVSRLASRVFVQWPGVLNYYGSRAEYRGRVI